MEDKRRMALVAWDKVCKPRKWGGLHIPPICILNSSLLIKQAKNVLGDVNDQNSIVKFKYLFSYLRLDLFFMSNFKIQGSFFWNYILSVKDTTLHKAKQKLGDGRKINFWEEIWIFNYPIGSNVEFNTFKEICIQRHGDKVCIY